MRRFLRMAAVIAITLGLMSICDFAIGQVATRTIHFDRKVPIAERLVAGDTNVVVKKAVLPPLVGTPGLESFEEEVRRLSEYQTILLLAVSASDGQLSDLGTWVRTRLFGSPVHVVKQETPVSGGSVEFWHDGGSTAIGSVVVTADLYPQFIIGQQYLVFLATDRRRATNYAALSFHVNAQGNLEAMRQNDGSRLMADSTLIGRPISEILAAFGKEK